jgi:hypothetical protein
MWVRSQAGVLGVDRSRGQREQQSGDGRGGDSYYADSETASGVRRSGTIGSSGG